MIPILKNKDEEILHFLKDCISCEVTEERNGVFELSITYPVKGQGYVDLKESNLILAKPNDTSENQLFSIYEISKPISGIVTVKAEHVSYATSHYPIVSLESDGVSASSALSLLTGCAVGNTDFTQVSSDIATLKNISYKACSLRAAFGGVEGSVLDLYGGEFEFDNRKTILHKSRGKDTGVIISYGKNLTDLKCTTSKENSYTAIFPYYLKDDVYITLTEITISVDNNSDIEERILLKDFTSEFDDKEEPTEELLRTKTNVWLDENDINSLSLNMIVGFQHLWQSPEYKDFQALEKVSLCDIVNVWHKRLQLFIKAKVIKTVYDVLTEKYRKIELGDARANFASALQNTQSEFASKLKESQKNSYSKITAEYEKAIKNATNKITGYSGGYVVQDPPENPQRLLIMNTPSTSTATKGWQWNVNGLGYFSNGINGPYKTAITMDGQIVADFITAGSMTANIIKAGILQSADGKSYFNLDSGVICTNKAQITGGTVNITCDLFSTDLSPGFISQSYNGSSIGSITPVGGIYKTSLYQSLVSSYGAAGIGFYYTDSSYTFKPFMQFKTVDSLFYLNDGLNAYFSGSVVTHADNATDVDKGLVHFRKTAFTKTSDSGVTTSEYKTYAASFGIGKSSKYVNGGAVTIQLLSPDKEECWAGLNIAPPVRDSSITDDGDNGVIRIYGSNTEDGFSAPLELGQKKLWWEGKGGIYANGIALSSTEDIKEDIRDTDDVLSLFETSKIYTYKYIQEDTSTDNVYEEIIDVEISNNGSSESGSDGSSEETGNIAVEVKDSIGFVIGRETPDAVITADGKHIDLYSMIAICWKGIQELYNKITLLEDEISKLNGG